ncbi:hypothetical protein PENTCL1PPCAC_10707 [Pristionchus entomophagus]|uniref:X-box-binding protein 1 n=1 Tax=Pristionchus entomophagus TaxID=358040 RepID=A0AAV5T1V7_9BILA|nr:hypothetical protein PENTCL1PPCAC_10707 [Pristionchus entomophagus]
MAPTRIVLLPAGTIMHPQPNQRKVLIPSSSRPSMAPSTSFAPQPQAKMERATTPRRPDPLELLNPTPISKTRKRERLTTLSADEKMARRKMKNRVAAQTARDRKKERTCGLEDAVKDLLDENKRLREENASLMARLDRLEAQSAATRGSVQQSIPQMTYPHRPVKVSPSTTDVTPLGSAASINDLQQRAQAVTTVSTPATTTRQQGTVSRLNLVPIMMLLLSSLPSTSIESSKISETSTLTRCVRPSMRTSRRTRLSIIHRLISKRPHPIPRRPP